MSFFSFLLLYCHFIYPGKCIIRVFFFKHCHTLSLPSCFNPSSSPLFLCHSLSPTFFPSLFLIHSLPPSFLPLSSLPHPFSLLSLPFPILLFPASYPQSPSYPPKPFTQKGKTCSSKHIAFNPCHNAGTTPCLYEGTVLRESNGRG